jgi:hypothetical protein
MYPLFTLSRVLSGLGAAIDDPSVSRHLSAGGKVLRVLHFLCLSSPLSRCPVPPELKPTRVRSVLIFEFLIHCIMIHVRGPHPPFERTTNNQAPDISISRTCTLPSALFVWRVGYGFHGYSWDCIGCWWLSTKTTLSMFSFLQVLHKHSLTPRLSTVYLFFKSPVMLSNFILYLPNCGQTSAAQTRRFTASNPPAFLPSITIVASQYAYPYLSKLVIDLSRAEKG